nr:nucleoside recognition protein [Bacillota bacterium]
MTASIRIRAGPRRAPRESERRVNGIGEALARGLRKGVQTTILLAKAIVPAYIIVFVLAHTPVLGWIAAAAAPLLHWIGLPGEAAVPLILGLFVNLYAAIGAMASLTLTAKEMTIIAIFLSMAHSLVVETAVTSRIGVPARLALTIRLGLAVLLATIVNVAWRA